jgi:putative adenylate-forming enzyme
MNYIDRFFRHLLARQIDRQFTTWDRPRLEAHQAQRLKFVLGEISRRSPYYARLRAQGWDGSLAALLVITKQELVAHYDEINTAGLRSVELSQFAVQQERAGRVALYQGKYSVGLSSGTSGNKLVTVLSRGERWNYSCLLWARSGIPREVRDPRVLFALRVNNPAFMETRALGVTLVHVDYTHPPEDVVQLINQKRLNILAGPPSLLRMLARLRGQIMTPVQGIISYAEVLDDASKSELEEAFGVRVAQIYQGAEGFIGSTCRMGKMHINEDTLFVEKFPAGDSIGTTCKLVVTDLYRLTQPFLRYSMGDLVDISPEPCACGSCFQVIERIHGRADDIFYLRGPGDEHRYLFPDYITRSINQASDAVLEFQAIQHSLNAIEIRLVLKPGTDPAPVEALIRANLAWWAEKAGGKLGQVSFTPTLPTRNPNSRKFIRVVRKF